MDFFLFNIFWVVLSSLIGFCILRKHILLALLSLESCNLGLFLAIIFYLSFYYSESYLYLVFLIFVVCEGVLGLCLLVSFMRGRGNDYVYGLEMLC
uniref:NADH-ubiquinone oxidoreductase chain 4L n=1 Tax=Hackeriella veitchi TaxID=60873 RepID=L7N6J6_9HEMI|nr:NADH dehydrogenase subunit 4L [Hackeriella veitchi]ACV96709.1 NADH dehydrogenase subunit 4L [Hackeriella veitchi]